MMMKTACILFFSMISLTMVCQQRQFIDGVIQMDSLNVSDVHIINTKTNIGTISNTKGLFEIPVNINDSLFISHINYKESFVLITARHIKNKKITIQLKEKVESLSEFTLKKEKSIFYVDKEIQPYSVAVSASSLHLPYAKTKGKKNESIVNIRSGAVINLENLIGAINGNNRKKRELEKMMKEDLGVDQIRKHFTDDFFISQLKIKKDFINQFLTYCKNKHIITDFKSKNQIDFLNILIKHSKQYLYKMDNEEGYISKN